MGRAWLGFACAALIVQVSGCADDEGPFAEPSEKSQSQGDAETGDAAVWSLPKDSRLTADTTSLLVKVQRLACNSGVTGKVLEPSVTYTSSQLVVTFEVARDAENSATCQANEPVTYEVNLRERLGDRTIVDGACLPGGEAKTTSWCRRDGVRWPV